MWLLIAIGSTWLLVGAGALIYDKIREKKK